MNTISSTIPSPFLNVSNATEIPALNSVSGSSQTVDVMMILSATIASVGIVGNLTVIIVFLNDKKLRKKIPNIFIIHQVSFMPIAEFSESYAALRKNSIRFHYYASISHVHDCKFLIYREKLEWIIESIRLNH